MAKEVDIFAPTKKLAPTPATIVDFLNENVRAYLSNANILSPDMGVEVKTKKKVVKKAVVNAKSPAQRAVYDFGGRWALEMDGAGERMVYYWSPGQNQPEIRMYFFMADKSFRVVEVKV